jgi:hypothetical protein
MDENLNVLDTAARRKIVFVPPTPGVQEIDPESRA